MEEISSKTVIEKPKKKSIETRNLLNFKSNTSSDIIKSISDNHGNKKHLLIAHKINIKEKKNNYLKEGINEIFNDKNIYFNDKYKNIRIIVGRNKSKILKSKEISENPNNLLNYKFNINKHRFRKSNSEIGNFSNKILKFDEISKSFSSKALIDNNIIKASELKEMNNKTGFNNKNDTIGKNFNLYGKRSNIYYSNINNITDGELKIIYRKFFNIAEKNKKIEILKKIPNKNTNDRKNMLKSISMTSVRSIDKEMKSRLHLQEKILNKFKMEYKANHKLKQKIMKYTSKENDNLLMNQVDKYRNRIEKIEEDNKVNNEYNYFKTIRWISSLRNYSKGKIRNDEEDINKNNSAFSLPVISNKNANKSKSKDKDGIYNPQCSFGNNSNLHCDIDSHISPLYALILSDSIKTNEKITNTHIDDLDNKSSSIELSSKLKKKSFCSFIKK